MNCKQCGTELTEEDIFCYKCGLRINKVKIMSTTAPMGNLYSQQRQEAERLFSMALSCLKSNDLGGAVENYTISARYKHPGAQNNLGNMYKSGRGVTRDVTKAFELFLYAAEHSNIVAMRNLATCYQDGVGTEKNFDLAVSWLMTAAKQNDPLACAMLAKAYDSWDHRDEEKKIYWHEKAAELGNADSMIWLGEYYAKNGEKQDLIKASIYYDNAAKTGKSEIILKVAKAFDKPQYGTNDALNLDKARHWYIEVTRLDNEKLQLEAAKALDEVCNYDGEIVRSALDIKTAYFVYRQLAMKGNKEAIILTGYCFEIGKVAPANLDMAIMWYEKAGNHTGRERAEWCRKKKAGMLSDAVYESHKNYDMTAIEWNEHSHGKEYYRQDVNFNKFSYDGRIYYNNSSYLCSSDFTGNDVKIISYEDKYCYSSIYVNATGIYLYDQFYGDNLYIKHMDFNGQIICETEEQGNISNVYIYDDQVFYVASQEVEKNGEYYATAQIKCLDASVGIRRVLYNKATSVDKLYARDSFLYFHAKYYNDKCESSCSDDGWMILNLTNMETECLSSEDCNPENVVDEPDVYNEESLRYIEKNNKRDIVFLDLNRDIFWTERITHEGEDSAHLKKVRYWEPKAIRGNRDEVLSDKPVWKITCDAGYGREYFDGIHHYFATDYHHFSASDKYGNNYEWGNSGHGVCDKFMVLYNSLFLDLEAYGEEQYDMSLRESEAIRKSWFGNNLTNDLICEYENRGKEVGLEIAEPILEEPQISNIYKSYEEELDLPIDEKDTTEKLLLTPELVQNETKIVEGKSAVIDDKLRLCDFRLNAEKFDTCREILVDYRKSLQDKWDYNAFVGILMSVKGPKHGDVACMNMAIGQGDNFKSTETKLSEKGLLDLFMKYRGNRYYQDVTVEQVESEIIEIAPEYNEIKDFFNRVVVDLMNSGDYETVQKNQISSTSNNKPDQGAERVDHDLVVAKNIGQTDIKYNICTFGSKFHIGFGVPVTIVIDGISYKCKTHNSAKGRIDGLKNLYTENNIVLGDMIKATYSAEDNVITLERI